MTDSITLLTSKGPNLCKSIEFDATTNRCRETGSYQDAKYFSVSEVSVNGVDDVFMHLKAASTDRKTAIVWGEPAAGIDKNHTARDRANFPETPRHWIPFDLDACEIDPHIFDPVIDIPDLAAMARESLPVEFRDVRCVFNVTNTHSKESGKARLRLYFWSGSPVTKSGMQAWVKGCEAKIDAGIWTSNQLIYTSNPSIEMDFIAERWGVVPGVDEVAVPDYVLAANTAAVSFIGSTDAYALFPDEEDSAAGIKECTELLRGILQRKVDAGEFGASGTRRVFWTSHSNIFGDYNVSIERAGEIAQDLMSEMGTTDENVLAEIPGIIERYDKKRTLSRGYSTRVGRAGHFGSVTDPDDAPPKALKKKPYTDVLALKDLSLDPPKWPAGTLPDDLEQYATHVGDRLCVGQSVACFSHLVAMSVMVPMGITLDVLGDGTFTAHTSIYAMIVGRSRSAKSPILNAAIAPLEVAERTWAVENAKALDIANEQEAMAQRTLKVKPAKPSKDAAKEPIETSEDDAADMPPRIPDKVIIRRRLVQDATTEALAAVFMQTTEGLIMVVDELAAMFGNIDRYHSGRGGASKDSATYLSAYDGRMIRIDRKNSDPIAVDRTHLSILGTIQPAVLAPLIQGLSGDGFAQRFLVCLAGEPYVDRNRESLYMPHAVGYREACNLLLNIVKTHGQMTFKLSFAASEWWREADAWTRAVGLPQAESEAERGFISKMPGLLARTALSLHLIDWAFNEGLYIAVAGGDTSSPPRLEISAEVMNRAWRIVKDFHLANAKQTYAGAERSGRLDEVKKLARWIKTLPLVERDVLTLRECYRKFRGYLQRKDDLFLALADLEGYGWLESIDGKSWKVWEEVYSGPGRSRAA